MYFIKELEIHKQIFPQATPEDQLLHLCEELNEMKLAKETKLDEWGDALFVAISLQRFEHTKQLANMMFNDLYFNHNEIRQQVIYKHLQKAVDKVKSRKYFFVNGRYERNKNV